MCSRCDEELADVHRIDADWIAVLANGCESAFVLGGEAVVEGSFAPAWQVMYQDLKRRVCQVLEEDYYGEWPEERKRQVRRAGIERRKKEMMAAAE